MTFVGREAAEGPARQAGLSEVRIYPHSPFLYWWVVWAYGFVCAFLTWAQGESLSMGGGRAVLVHPQAWVGISFTLVVVFTALATTVKVRGVGSVMLIAVLIGAAAAAQLLMTLDGVIATGVSLRVHMNLAFYMMVSSSVLVAWVVVVFVVDRLSYWRFRGAQIERVQRFANVFGHAPESYSVMHVKLTCHGDDVLTHKILALAFLGLGTSDIDAKIAIFGGGNEHVRLENVRHGAQALREIQAMMGQKATVVI